MKKILLALACLPVASGALAAGDILPPQNDSTLFIPYREQFVELGDSLTQYDATDADAQNRIVLVRRAKGTVPEAYPELADSVLSLMGMQRTPSGGYALTADSPLTVASAAQADSLRSVPGRNPMMNCYENVTARISYLDPFVVSVVVDTDAYMGGAHGMYGTRTLTYMPGQKHFVKLEDLLAGKADSNAKLNALLSKKLLEWLDMTAAQAREMSVNLKVTPAETFAFTPEGVTFYYQPYELGPWAIGAPQLSLTYDELEGVL